MNNESLGQFVKTRFIISTETAGKRAHDKESYRRAIVTDFIQMLYHCVTSDDIDEHVVGHVLEVLNFCCREQKKYDFVSMPDMEIRMEEELPEDAYEYIKERYEIMIGKRKPTMNPLQALQAQAMAQAMAQQMRQAPATRRTQTKMPTKTQTKAKKLPSTSEEEDTPKTEPKVEAPKPEPKKRGRPRKVTTENAEPKPAPKPKGKRGRKKKVTSPTPSPKSETANSEQGLKKNLDSEISD